jgi:hypothetical protein
LAKQNFFHFSLDRISRDVLDGAGSSGAFFSAIRVSPEAESDKQGEWSPDAEEVGLHKKAKKGVDRGEIK